MHCFTSVWLHALIPCADFETIAIYQMLKNTCLTLAQPPGVWIFIFVVDGVKVLGEGLAKTTSNIWSHCFQKHKYYFSCDAGALAPECHSALREKCEVELKKPFGTKSPKRTYVPTAPWCFNYERKIHSDFTSVIFSAGFWTGPRATDCHGASTPQAGCGVWPTRTLTCPGP